MHVIYIGEALRFPRLAGDFHFRHGRSTILSSRESCPAQFWQLPKSLSADAGRHRIRSRSPPPAHSTPTHQRQGSGIYASRVELVPPAASSDGRPPRSVRGGFVVLRGSSACEEFTLKALKIIARSKTRRAGTPPRVRSTPTGRTLKGFHNGHR